jgi:hypothetical protein
LTKGCDAVEDLVGGAVRLLVAGQRKLGFGRPGSLTPLIAFAGRLQRGKQVGSS